MFRKGPIQRRNDGYTINVDAAHRRVLADMLGQLRDGVVGSADDEQFRRLFPAAYHQDPDFDGEYRRLMHSELLASRLEALASTMTILERDTNRDSVDVTMAELDALTRSLNDLRLVLGTLLDVQESDYDDPPAPDDPTFPHFQLYGYLGWLLEWAVQSQQDAIGDE
jgi:hypothetical protein